MKNKPLLFMIGACVVIAVLMCGIFIGRNLTGDNIQISALTTRPSEQGQSTDGTQTSLSAEIEGKININTADLYTLTKLKGIAEVYAQRIIDYRTANGPFYKIEDIMKVEGIGAKRFEDIKDLITTGD